MGAMASTSAQRRSTRGPAAQTVLPDEIWEDIFLRLDAAADFARASATCSSFRRIVSEPRFLRRFRSLRSPAILGFISYRDQGFIPVGPHRSAPEARALELAADFTFSFLPKPHPWQPCDARDGRVLLSRRISASIALKDFVVCDPLHRRYVMIPRIPDDLMASAADKDTAGHMLPALAPAGENDEDESFRVIYIVQHKGNHNVMAFVYSSCNQMWQGIISATRFPNGFNGCKPYYVHGCLYWMLFGKDYSLMLDTTEMKFSKIDLPPHNFYSTCAIVEAEEGRLGFFNISNGTIDLYCKNWQSNGVGAQEWQLDKLIPLPKDSGIDYSWNIVGTVGHYLALLASRPLGIWDDLRKNDYFVLDTKTLLLEKLCRASDSVLFFGIPYARFPPPFALPSI